MAMEFLARYSLPAADRAGTVRGADALRRVGAGDRVEVRITRADGAGEEAVDLPPAAAGLAGDLLGRASDAGAGALALLAEDAEVSPEEAAAILGVSRPLVRRRMDGGVLPYRRVGAHRRLRLADVLALKRREAPVRAAMEELAADTDELARAHGL